MKTNGLFFAITSVILLNVGLLPLNADVKIEQVIHHNLYSTNPYLENLLGIAYNPSTEQIYLSQGGGGHVSLIYTIDKSGNLLNTWSVRTTLGPYCCPTTISYAKDSGHLFINQTIRTWASTLAYHILEMSVDGVTTYNDFDITNTNYINGGGGLFVDSEGIWLSSYINDTITHLSLNGQFIEQFPVDMSMQHHFGIMDLCASFNNGFFLLDNDYGRIVNINKRGNIIGALPTANEPLWNGSGLAIDSDVASRLVYIQHDDDVYVLSGLTLLVVTPNGGEHWIAGTTQTIQWQSTDLCSSYMKIKLSTNNGIDWNDVNTVPNNGSYQWLIPQVTSNQCLIRLSDANDANMYDTSNNVFTIYQCQLLADLNHDCKVDFVDFAILANAWASNSLEADLNGDNVLDLKDIAQFALDWLTCNRNPAGECWQ
jgi:hypothetical protein